MEIIKESKGKGERDAETVIKKRRKTEKEMKRTVESKERIM